ncbi:EF-P 5-aminopentanol modification-associated protein YfmH [Mechercharimyces sp. CAU 1602]|uniref:EF-P 5-aminopentanol modification-associated protein YfmH n=1 Tax=Mechercharimyces sp. CAU 1602 TaxID=2973933 RepID=UPI0021634FE1|nr:pitrilysin family protein [Mechercharimyces sp. CAU 1602]MCS1351244.1 insulinase family protein [Mechercharimyces sp. CAU 1602]
MEQLRDQLLQETYYQEQLDNGLTVVLLPRPDYVKTYAMFTTRYGSIDQHFRLPDGEKLLVPDGIAHFLEHKMFEEAEGDVFQQFSQQGASANAFTSFNRTSYLFTGTEKIEENLTTLLNFVQRLYLTDENVEKEKGIIGQEIRMYEDNPDWRVYFGLIGALFQKHPVRIDIAGTIQSIAKIDKEVLTTCHETFYHPSNMFLFVVGPMDPKKTIALIRENQDKKPFRDRREIERFFSKEPEAVATKRAETSLSVGIGKCYFGFKEIKLGAQGDQYLKQQLSTELMLESIFGSGSSFYQSLYDEGLIDEQFGASYSLEKEFGFSAIGGDTVDPDRLLTRVKEELPKRVKQGISEDDFLRLRNKEMGRMVKAFNSPEWIANQYTGLWLNDASLLRYLPVLDNLTVDDVNQRMKEHIDEERFAASIVKPL